MIIQSIYNQQSPNKSSSRYYHPDHLGSTQLVTNSTGGVVENTSYDPYGNTIEGSDSRYSYNAKERDIGTDLLYYGARYYYSNGPFFIMPDPFIQDYYNPQSLNRYSYVLNNPYKYVDPSGESPIVATALIGFAIGAGYNIYEQYRVTGSLSHIDYVSAGKSGLVGAVGVSIFVLTGGTGALGTSTIVAGALSATGSNLAAYGLYGNKYLQYLEDSTQSNKEIDKLGIFPGMDLPGTSIFDKEDKKVDDTNINKKITIDNQIANQQLQTTLNQFSQRDSLISSGSGAFGASYIVRNPDGSYIIRTNVESSGYMDTPISNKDKKTWGEK